MTKPQLVFPFLGIMVAFTVNGCVSYSAQIQRTERRGDFRIKLDSATVQRGGEATVTMIVQSIPKGVKLLEASVSASGDRLCESKITAKKIGRSSGKSVQEALTSGERIGFGFNERAFFVLTGESPRIDLLVETPKGVQRCVPISIRDDDTEVEWRARQRWTVGIDLTLQGFTSRLGSVSQFVSFPLTFGYWLNAFHLEVGGGVVASGCPDSVCEPESEKMRIHYSTGAIMFAGVDRPIYEFSEISVGAGFRYRVMYLTADTRDGYERYWMHGPVFAPYIGAVMPVAEGESGIGGAQEGLAAFEIPISGAFSSGRPFTLTIGGSLRFRFTSF